MVILFAGLPGTGKSFLANKLSAEIDADVLDRDAIRDAIFPERALDYSEPQNEIASQVSYLVARYLLEDNIDKKVILDGRPFSKRQQIEEVQQLTEDIGHRLYVVYCWAPDDVVERRLEEDAHRMKVADRNMNKYRRIKQCFEPITLDHLQLDTTRPASELVQQIADYIYSEQ